MPRLPRTPARIYSQSVLATVDVGDGFAKREGAFCTPAGMAGSSPMLNLRASVALGSLQLRMK